MEVEHHRCRLEAEAGAPETGIRSSGRPLAAVRFVGEPHEIVRDTVDTPQMYTGAPTLDELAKAIEGYRFGAERTRVPPDPQIPLEAPTGIEPVYTALQAAA